MSKTKVRRAASSDTVFEVEQEELGFLVAVMEGAGNYIEQEIFGWKKPGIPSDLHALEEEMQFY